jgi:MurNAc alpha-1-phosphate uridylyltransferase
MRAMILAAGRGERMKHLTTETPKALLRLGNRYLIEYSITALAKIGVREIIINVCYKAEQIKAALGAGTQYGVKIIYSDEPEALETGGGIFQALSLLGSEPFIVLSCDVVSDYPLQNLPKNPDQLAHLVLVDNPDFHPSGDFCLAGKQIYLGNDQTYTFGNIGVYRPELFADCKPGKFRLGDLLKQAIQNVQVTGERYSGFWQNFGTPAQLENKIALPDSLF